MSAPSVLMAFMWDSGTRTYRGRNVALRAQGCRAGDVILGKGSHLLFCPAMNWH